MFRIYVLHVFFLYFSALEMLLSALEALLDALWRLLKCSWGALGAPFWGALGSSWGAVAWASGNPIPFAYQLSVDSYVTSFERATTTV